VPTASPQSSARALGSHQPPLRDIVSDVLDLAKAEAGGIEAEPSSFALDPLLREIEDLGIALTEGTDVLFILDSDGVLGEVFTDRLKLKQVLFKAFSQVTGPHAPRAGGTGLGLYISERYVRTLGGRMSVSSREGEGSMFDFVLPRSLAALLALALAIPAAAQPQPTALRIEGTAFVVTTSDGAELRSPNWSAP
jgi:signal transduction histidine kinase